MDYDPNLKDKPKVPRWATYVPDRRSGGKFKIHTNLGHAKNAFQGQRDAILYEWMPDDDMWVERARIEGFVGYRAPCPRGCGEKTHSAGWTDMVFELRPCYKCSAEERRVATAMRELGIS